MSTHSTRTVPWLCLVASITVLSIYALQYPLNHDVGWWIHVSRSILEGDSLYRDVIEINPPLYGYIVMVPLVLADLSNLPALIVARVVILSTCVLVILLSTRLSHKTVENTRTAIVFGLIIALGLLGLPGTDFGQREHLMFALVLPYLLLDAYRTTDASVERRSSIGIGILAGVGFCLKPQFGLIFLLLEGILAVIRRDWKSRFRRAELVTVIVLATVYLATVLVAYPDYVHLLRESQHLYAAFADVDRSRLLLTPYSVLLAGVVIGLVMARRISGAARSIALHLVVFAGAAWLVAVLQGKGWTYHFYPGYAASVIAGLVLTFEVLVRRRDDVRSWRSQVIGGLACVGMAVIVWLGHRTSHAEATYRRATVETRREFLEQANAESFVVLSPMVSDGFPLVNYSGLQWTSPFPTLWWLQFRHASSNFPGFSSSPANADSVEIAFRSALVRDMSMHQPDVVFVDTATNPRFGNRSFPYVDYLSEEPSFRNLWQNYVDAGGSGRFQIYRRARGDLANAP